MRESLKAIFTGVEREAWIRFLIAIFGLVFAFAAALLSSASSEAGNMLASVIFASGALLVALIVGLTTIPYLARRVIAGRVREVMDYDITREGMAYLLFTVVIGIAALNTGNNLLFLVVAAMLAAVLVSGIDSALNLRGVELEITLPGHIFAGRHVLGRIILRVRRRVMPLFSATVVAPKPEKSKGKWIWHRAMFEFPKQTAERKSWVRWPDIALERVCKSVPPPKILRDQVYFPYIAAGETGSADVELFFDKRGRYVQDGFGLATRFPFSFLKKTRRIALTREVIVFPSVEPTDELFEVLPMMTGEFESYVRGRGFDLYRIREYEPEDSARHVDWKSTAKSGSLKVREFTREDERKLRIVFDNPAPSAVTADRYERAVALAASLSWHFAGENTDLTFAANGYPGSDDLYHFLEYLALVQPKQEASIIDQLQVTDDYNLVFTTRARGSIPTALWQSSYFIFIQDR
jgi:uncharacterized protein (DUF58 family)